MVESGPDKPMLGDLSNGHNFIRERVARSSMTLQFSAQICLQQISQKQSRGFESENRSNYVSSVVSSIPVLVGFKKDVNV